MPTCLYCNEEFKYEEVLFAEMREATDKEREDGEDIFGCWVKDDVYDDHMKRFLYTKNDDKIYKPREIFAVKWGKESRKGVGKGILLEDQNVPVTVELCAEDKEACNGTPYLANCCCPRCHSVLPRNYLNKEENVCRVALLGGSRAGKTQYLLAAYQNMAAYLATVYQLASSVKIDEVGKRIMEHLYEEFKKNNYIGRTPMEYIRPIVLTISQSTEDKYLVLYDVPGEVFMDKYVNQMLKHEGVMRLADTLLIVADSAGQVFSKLKNNILNQGSNDENSMIEALVKEAPEGDAQGHAEQHSGEGEDAQTCMELSLNDMIINYSTYAQTMRRDEQGNFRPYKVLGLLLTKFDKAIDRKAASFLERPLLKCVMGADFEEDMHTSVHYKGVDMDAILSVHHELRQMIEQDRGDAILCDDILKTIREQMKKEPIVFGVSTYERMNETEGFRECMEASLNRHRVLDPFFYLLAEQNFVEQKGNTEKMPEKPHRFRWFWQR